MTQTMKEMAFFYSIYNIELKTLVEKHEPSPEDNLNGKYDTIAWGDSYTLIDVYQTARFYWMLY